MYKIFILTVLFLTGCYNSDVNDFVDNHKNKKIKPSEIPTVPEIKKLSYKSSRIRSPFSLSINKIDDNEEFDDYLNDYLESENENNKKKILNKILITENDFYIADRHPDGNNRSKEYLEQFNLNNLRYVGYISKKDYSLAIILDPEGKANYVQSGHFLGKNSGLVKKIYPKEILIREILPDVKGSWNITHKVLKLHELKDDSNQQ